MYTKTGPWREQLMEVFIYHQCGDLLTSGTMLVARSKIGTVKVGHTVHSGSAEFGPYYRQHPNGITVGGKDNVTMIVGGRKSIVRELTANPLLLMPAPGQNLAMSAIRATLTVAPVGTQTQAAFSAPKFAIQAARGHEGGIGGKIKHGAKYFAAVHEAIGETRKKYTFIQIYSGQPDPGHHAVGNGAGQVDTRALAVQLQGLPGWSD
jgi:hypothetical protein